MSAVIWRRSRWFGLSLIVFAGATAAQAETVTVSVDQARVIKMPERVATIVIGNPLIADATLQKGGILVLTGKGFGSTNLMALDRAGDVVMDKTVEVQSPTGVNLVVVYKGTDRESYSCAPECERRITLGDAPDYFNTTLSQAGARLGRAQVGTPQQ